MAFIQIELEADQVVEAMLEDAGFARDLWRGLAQAVDAGRALDDAADLFGDDAEGGEFVAAMLERVASAIRSRH